MSRITMALENDFEGRVLASFDLDEFASKVRADAEEDAENRMNRILDDEKRLAYELGRADAIEEITENIIPTLYEFDVMQDTIDFCVKCLESLKEQKCN